MSHFFLVSQLPSCPGSGLVCTEKKRKRKSVSKLSFLLYVILIFHIWTIIQLEFLTFYSLTKLERDVILFRNCVRENNNFWLFHKNYRLFNDQWRATDLNGNVDPERQQDSFVSLNFTLRVMDMMKFDHTSVFYCWLQMSKLHKIKFQNNIYSSPTMCIAVLGSGETRYTQNKVLAP